MKPDIDKSDYLLYADDDADDRMLLVDTFYSIAPEIKVQTVTDGYATLEFLHTQTPPLPRLLILDLNMPGMNGKELLHSIKAVKDFSKMPIVVFTTSANVADKEECGKYGVELVTKPLDIKDLELIALRLLKYCH